MINRKTWIENSQRMILFSMYCSYFVFPQLSNNIVTVVWTPRSSLFSRESNSTFTNVCSLVCLLVIKTPQQLEIIILHHSSIIFQHSSFIPFFIIFHSSFLHIATFKIFSLFKFSSNPQQVTKVFREWYFYDIENLKY